MSNNNEGKKKILKSTHRPDFTIPFIAKLEGIKREEKHESDRFTSPIFGRKVPDKIVVPKIDNPLKDTGKRLDAFRDMPKVKGKDDYSEFNIINTKTRAEVLGGSVYEEEVIEEKIDIEDKKVEKVIKVEEEIFSNNEVKEEINEDKNINLTPIIEEDEIEDDFINVDPKPEVFETEGLQSKGSFESFNPDVSKEEVKTDPLEKEYTKPKKYILPDPKMFKVKENELDQTPEWVLNHIDIINDTLESFNIDAKVIGHVKGPTVTRYEVSIGPGVRSNRITGIADNLQMNLQSTSIRIETPVPGKPFAGLEVPNVNPEIVYFGNVVNDKEFLNDKSPLKVALGVDIDGSNVYVDITKMPHGLIAGATNSGKSVCVNTLLASLLMKNTPDELKLILIDPKIVELSAYNDLPHLITPVITEPKMASEALKWVVDEMEDRYKKFAENRSRDIKSYNENIKRKKTGEKHMPYIVIVIDELADLMNVAANDVEESIQRITQKARAAGIHLIIATQRPSTDVVKGTIKSNIPSRIAFKVSSHVDSQTILDSIGAEQLLGKGDMLLKGSDRLIRLQGAFIPDEEIYDLTDYIREQRDANYEIDHSDLKETNRRSSGLEPGDEDYINDIAYFVVSQNVASINRVLNEFKIGFNRAQRIINELGNLGVVSESEGTKPREVLVNLDELEEILNRR